MECRVEPYVALHPHYGAVHLTLLAEMALSRGREFEPLVDLRCAGGVAVSYELMTRHFS